MQKTIHARENVNGLYLSREEEIELANKEDSDEATMQRLKDYINKHGGRLITVTRDNTNNAKINIINMTRKQKWEEKEIYRYFKRKMCKISHDVV